MIEPATVLNSFSTEDRFPEIAAEYGSGETSDQAVLVRDSSGGPSDVWGQPVEAIGGGCRGGGSAGVNGPAAVGNADFALTLSGLGGPEVALVIRASPPNLACGRCTLVPALDLLFMAPSPIPLPIPCHPALLGATFYPQWIAAFPGGCPLAPNLTASVPLSIVIGL
jgi:hypothetical protein